MAGQNLREQNKQRNFERILQVAKQLFELKGYEATTTREIAETAQIATGTLFLYARDKAELLLFTYGEAISEITTSVFASLPKDLPLLDALMYIFTPFFQFYAQHPENARFFLKELLFYSGEHKGRQSFHLQTEHFIKQLAQFVRHAQERGEIRPDVDSRQAASSFFAMYFATLTTWLGGFFLLNTASVDQLRAVFELQIKGMLPPDSTSEI
ncbi:TetR/AcrR family transcriptional regulator [Ktedonobacter racemifer]|uniref:Transcriptional regulator, TetR family n=1 Tax=Ktedonobacter racemifer DSM 44963 TaxID=485913 RepID=D6TUV9_KTERA|nr:TetR/AcrR family transcriptional regulator [Ktedonobacter racemifer]EFH85285.1 transcriptional regulator, TetR family [Ktedonobacter racemifer DSM 44963]